MHHMVEGHRQVRELVVVLSPRRDRREVALGDSARGLHHATEGRQHLTTYEEQQVDRHQDQHHQKRDRDPLRNGEHCLHRMPLFADVLLG